MKKVKASLTLEASICICVLFFMATFIFLLSNIFSYYTTAQSAVNNTAVKLSAGIYDENYDYKIHERYGKSAPYLRNLRKFPDAIAIYFMGTNEYALAHGLYMYSDDSVSRAVKYNVVMTLFISYFGNNPREVLRNFNIFISNPDFEWVDDGKTVKIVYSYEYDLLPFASGVLTLPIEHTCEVEKW